MEALNFIEIETKSGYRSFELYCGDLTDLAFKVDLICISAFANDYLPIQGTVIGALNRRGVIVEQIAQDCLFDFRNSFGGWVSKKIDGWPYKHILCIEMKGTKFGLEDAIKNIFTILSILEIKRLQIHSIALPLIGTGDQNFEPRQVITLLIDSALDFLQHARYLDKIAFVEHNPDKATELNKAMDEVLGRSKVKIPRGPLVDAIKQEIIGDIEKVSRIIGSNEIFSDLRRVISSSHCRSFELCGVSRKVVEFIAQDLSPSNKQFELCKKIDLLSNVGIAQWIIGYMHVLRVFGNEAVHEKFKENRNPGFVDEKDLELCLFCIQRILDFYHAFKKQS